MPAARTLLTVTCLALVALLTPVALVASWMQGTLTETDRYVATVAPLATDTEVQAAVERHRLALVAAGDLGVVATLVVAAVTVLSTAVAVRSG